MNHPPPGVVCAGCKKPIRMGQRWKRTIRDPVAWGDRIPKPVRYFHLLCFA